MRRRGLLRLICSSATLSVLAVACAPAAPSAPTGPTAPTPTSGTAALALPAYVPLAGPPPDLPGSADGLLPPGYLAYPLEPVRSVQQPVGSGEEVTAVTYTTQAPPTPAEQNLAWQRAASLNQTMGDGLLAIIFGRAEMGTYDQLVKDWRSQGGDQIRAEFERTLAAGG